MAGATGLGAREEAKTMNVRTINRIIRGVLAAALLAIAGKEGIASGLTPGAVIAGGLGFYFLLGAATGKG